MSDQDINIRVLGDVAPFQAAMGDAAAAVQQVQGAAAGAAGGGGLNDLTQQLEGAAEAARDTGDALQDQVQDVIAAGGSWQSLAQLAGTAMQRLGGLTVVATTLAAAVYAGSQESVALANALTLTGNQAGVTTDQLVTMSRSVADAAGATRAAGTAAMAEVVAAGGIAAGQMEMVTAAALRLEDVGAQSVKDTVREFAELGREPVAASLALTEKLGYLTAETYEQIAALEEQGRTSEAAALAQQAYGAALDEVADGMEENLGWVEAAWNTLGSAAALAWDKILNIGREDTLAEQLAEAKRQMVEGVSFFERTAGFLTGETVDPAMAVKVIEAQIEAEEKAAKAKAEKIKVEAAHIGWLQDGERYLTKQQQMETEIAKARNQGLAAKRTEAEIEERIGQIRAKYAPKSGAGSGGAGGGSGAALAREAAAAEREHLKALREREKAELAAIALAERGLESLQAQVARQREANEEIGLSARALLDLTVARIEEASASNAQAAVAAELLGHSAAEIQAYKDKARALQDLADLKREGADAKEAVEDEEARAQAATQAAREAEDAWRQSAQQIEQSITDALLRGFESGKGIAETFRDTLENMFKTLVLRPVVSALVQPVANGIAGMVSGGGGGGGGSGGGGAGSSLGMAGNIYSLASNAGSLLGLTGAGAAAGTVGMANMAGMVGGDALGTLIAGNSVGWGTSAAGIAGGGAMGAIGAALPWIGGALAIASLLGAFDKKPSNKAAGGTVDLDSGDTTNWEMQGDKAPSDKTKQARDVLLESIFGIAESVKKAGGEIDLSQIKIDIGERDGFQVDFGEGMESLGRDAQVALNAVAERLIQEGYGEFDGEMRAIVDSLEGESLKALQVMSIARDGIVQIADPIKQMGDAQRTLFGQFADLGVTMPTSVAAMNAFAASLDLTDAAAQDTVIGMQALAPAFLEMQTALDGFYAMLLTPTETMAKSSADLAEMYTTLGVEMPKGVEGLRELIEAQDQSTEAGAVLRAQLLATVPAMTALQDSLLDFAGISGDEIATTLRDAMLGRISGDDAGGQIAQTVMDGIYNAIAGGFAQSITDIMIGQIITPVIQAAVTGSSVSAAVSQDAINNMVAAASAAASALNAIVSNAEFQAAMTSITTGITGTATAAAPRAAAPRTVVARGGGGGGGGSGGAAKNPADEWKKILDTVLKDTENARKQIERMGWSDYETALADIQDAATEKLKSLLDAGWLNAEKARLAQLQSIASGDRLFASMGGAPNPADLDAEIAALTARLAAMPPEIQAFIDAETALLDARNAQAAGETLAGLNDEMVRLGLSSGEIAAAEINDQLEDYIKQLRDLGQATDENRAQVEAWADAMRDAQAQDIFKQMRADLSAINLTPLQRELAGIDEKAEEFTLALVALGRATPEAIASVNEWASAMAQAAQQAEAQAAVSGAESALLEAYRREASAMQQVIDKFDRFTRSLRQFRDSLWRGESSPASGVQRLVLAEKQFNDLAVLAGKGDEAAMGELQNAATEYLALSKDQSVSAEDYYRKFARVQSVLERTERDAARSLSSAQSQLRTLESTVGALVTINGSVLSVKDAIANLAAALKIKETASAPRQNISSYVQPQVDSMLTWAEKTGKPFNGAEAVDLINGMDKEINALYQQILGRNAAQSGLDYYKDSGLSLKSIEDSIKASREAELRAISVDLQNQFLQDVNAALGYTTTIKAFAGGGMHAGGLRLVGENGPELEVTGPSRIYSATQTRAMLGGGSSDDLAREIKALRKEVESLRAASEATARHTQRIAKTQDRVTRNGEAMMTEAVMP